MSGTTQFPSLDWLRQRDPDFAALRRAGRTALVMPALFALGAKVIENPAVATFAAFGSFAMLLLVDFAGSDARSPAGTGGARARVRRDDRRGHASRRARRGWPRWRWRSWRSACCSPAWSARFWPGPRPRCCWRSSCRSRCRARSPRSRIGWPAGAWPPRPRCSPSRCCGRRPLAFRCAARRSTRAGRWRPGCTRTRRT